MSERMSSGTQFIGRNEFLHSRTVDSAVEVSRSSCEISSMVKL